jgi:hypothetical protein
VVADLGPDDAVATYYGPDNDRDDDRQGHDAAESVPDDDRRAAAILGWAFDRSEGHDIMPQGADSKELEKLYNAWRDVANFGSPGEGNYQVTTLLWGAHSLQTKDDFFYVQQLCAFNPEQKLKMRSGYLYRPKPITLIAWDKDSSERFCRSYDGGACEYNGYMTKYEIFLEPDKGVDLVQFLKAAPETEISHETWTTGVNWSVGGGFVAGVDCGKGCSANVGIEVNGGISVENTRQITKSDVTVRNRSLKTKPNEAGWEYSMPEVYGVHTGFCQRGVSRPKDAQIYAFQPENHVIWVTKPQLRSQAAGLKTTLLFRRTYADSRMNAIGPFVSYIEDFCNAFDCNCEPKTKLTTKEATHILTLPFPNTEKKP